MGLGKTVVSIAIAEELLGNGSVSTVLCVVPASLKYQWAAQIAKLTDVTTTTVSVKDSDGEKQELAVPTEDYCVVLGDGGPDARAAQYQQILETSPDYVILGYENVVIDWRYVRKIKPGCIVLDECTFIKTFSAQRTRKMKRLQATYKYGLTGTAVENGKPEEIYSIEQWLDPDLLGPFDLFDKAYIQRGSFGGVDYYKNLHVLHRKLKPAMSRKTREDPEVKPYLPVLAQKTIEIAMTPSLRKCYKLIGKELLTLLYEAQKHMGGTFDVFAHYSGGKQANDNPLKGAISSRAMTLDMLLDHPDLVRRSARQWEESESQRKAGVTKRSWPGSAYAAQLVRDGVLDGVHDSPKLDKTVETVTEILGSNPKNKVIIFSFYLGMLDILKKALPAGSVQYHGEMSDGEKAAAVQKFTDDPDCRIFLSSHAGTFGTDLYMANYLINYDQAPSSGKQDQINHRHDRVISTFERIFVLDMITKGTTEPRKFARNHQKRRVASAILDGVGSKDGVVKNSVESLTECLRETTR